MTTYEELIRKGRDRLKNHIATPDLDSRLLLQWVTGSAESTCFSHPRKQVSDSEEERFFRHVEERLAGTPLAYLTGHREFWSLDFEVSPSTLIPRPETELIVERVLQNSSNREDIVDIGTGSGNIAAAIAFVRPEASIIATDVSKRALKVAERNFEALGLGNIRLFQGPLFLPLKTHLSGQKFDLILSNPPYIPEKDWRELPVCIRGHEPKRALVPGPTGFEVISDLIKGAPDYLHSGGILIFEIGQGQKEPVLSFFSDCWSSVICHDDLAGIPRVFEAQMH